MAVATSIVGGPFAGGLPSFVYVDTANTRIGFGATPVASAGRYQFVLSGSPETLASSVGQIASFQSDGSCYITVRNTLNNSEAYMGCASTVAQFGNLTSGSLQIIQSSAGRLLIDSTDVSTFSGIGLRTAASRLQGNKGADVASAATITLGSTTNGGIFYTLTGATAIDYITYTGWQAGSPVWLFVPSGLTLNHLSGSPGANTYKLRNSTGANITGAANGTLVMITHNSSDWLVCKMADFA
jgi:hypothetical protein